MSISARAAEEAKSEGKVNITPYWRTIKSNGELNQKYPGGLEAHAEHLKKEGHTIEASKNKKIYKVKNFNEYLVAL